MIKQIIAGGQTGVDQAALDVANTVGIEIDGWCPKGGLDENGFCVFSKYPLKEAKTTNPDDRTQLNIINSDATLIIAPTWPLDLTIQDGTIFTFKEIIKQVNNFFILELSYEEHHLARLNDWIAHYHIERLNIAGPRESSSPGIYKKAYNLLMKIFSKPSCPQANRFHFLP